MNMNNDLTTKDDITILDVFNVFITHKRLIFLLSIFGFALGFVISHVIKPIYTSEALLISQLDNQQTQSSGLAGLAGLTGISFGSGASNKEAIKAMAVLKSRTFKIHVIQKENLKPDLFPELWNNQNASWISAEPSDVSAASSLDKLIEIKTSEKGLIRFSISSHSSELSSFLSNRIIFLINNYLRSQVIDEAEESINLLKEELKTTKLAALEQTIYSQIEGHTQSKTLANVRQEYAFKVIDNAIQSISPTWPNKTQIQLMGLAVGLLVGFLVSLFLGFFRKKA